MRLTYKDVITTFLAAATVAVTLAIVQEWDWPALGSPRAGLAAMGILRWFRACRRAWPAPTESEAQYV